MLKHVVWVLILIPLAETAVADEHEHAPARTPQGRYVEIPIVGDIGFDVTPTGFSQVIERARRSHATDGHFNVILLVIDSHGGSDAEAIEMANMLAGIDPAIHVVAAVRQAIGPAMALVLAADELVILAPGTPGVRLQYQPALGREMTVDHEAYRQINGLGPVAQVAVDAMFDPGLTVYAWDDASGERRAASTRPDGVEAVMELPPGSLADGLSAQELDRLGIGRSAATVAQVGSSIGYDSWTRIADYGEILKRLAREQSDMVSDVQRRLDRAMSLTGQALALEASLVELEGVARAADPRRQPYNYRSRFRGNFGYRGRTDRSGSGWGYSSPSTTAWRTNSDRAVAMWGRVITTIDQVFDLGGQARGELEWLQAQDLPPTMAWVNEDIRILKQELDPLLAQEGMLMGRRAAAASEAEFFQANRNRPIL